MLEGTTSFNTKGQQLTKKLIDLGLFVRLEHIDVRCGISESKIPMAFESDDFRRSNIMIDTNVDVRPPDKGAVFFR